jgi:MFS family permease
MPDDLSKATGRKTWQVGTLTYTTGGLAMVFAWLLLGDFSWNLKERAVTPVAQLMLRAFEAPDFLVGLLVGSLPAALGMIIGPIVSVRSDRYRSMLGRRIPFILLPTPFIVISMVALGYTPMLADWVDVSLGESSPGIPTIGLSLFILFWTAFEISSTVANVIFGALINDVVPHALIGRFFGLFRAVGLIAAIIFNYSIIGHAESHFLAIFVGAALIYGISFALMCLKVREGNYPPPPPSVSTGKALAPIANYFRECYSLSFYRWLFAAATLGMLASAPINSFSVFYAKSLDMEMAAYGKCLALTYAISLVLSYPLGSLADRFHPLRLGLGISIAYAITMSWAAIAVDSIDSFSVFFIIHGVATGAYFTATASLGQRLYPQMKFAQFASAWGITFGIGFVVTTPLIGIILDLTGHQYRLTFLASGGIAALSVFLFIRVYRMFMKLGGDLHYVPPEPELPVSTSAS